MAGRDGPDRAASTYRELPPPPALEPYVECLWVQRVGDRAYVQPVLPDGRVDVVALGSEVMLAGPATRTATLRLAPGTLTVGVRFRPGAAPALVGVGAAELRDRNLPLDVLWDRAGAELADRAADATGWQSRLRVLVDGMLRRVHQARPLDPVGVGIAALLAEHPGRPLAELAESVGVGERQLRRRVVDAVGYPPRTLARIVRFQHFLREARASGPERSLARLAAEAGYSDQAHLTRDSRELAGLPPAALLDWEAERLGR